MLRHGSSPSPEELMELYATLLRDNLGKKEKSNNCDEHRDVAQTLLWRGRYTHTQREREREKKEKEKKKKK